MRCAVGWNMPAIASSVTGHDSLVGSATIRVAPKCYVAYEDLTLQRGVQRRVGGEAGGVIERGG